MNLSTALDQAIDQLDRRATSNEKLTKGSPRAAELREAIQTLAQLRLLIEQAT